MLWRWGSEMQYADAVTVRDQIRPCGHVRLFPTRMVYEQFSHTFSIGTGFVMKTCDFVRCEAAHENGIMFPYSLTKFELAICRTVVSRSTNWAGR